jgi:hypothetical protein
MRAISPAASGDVRSVISAGGIKLTSPAACGDIALISNAPIPAQGPAKRQRPAMGEEENILIFFFISYFFLKFIVFRAQRKAKTSNG